MRRHSFRLTAVLLSVLILSLALVSCDSSVSDKGKLHILAMGDNFGSGIVSTLKTCENDAVATAEILIKRATEAGVTVGESHLLLGEEDTSETKGATAANFGTALNKIKDAASVNDITVIYLSTHGNNDIKKKVNYSDSNSKNTYFVLEDGSKGITFDDLLDFSNEIPGTILIIADLCFSGAFIEQNNVTYNVNNYSGTNPVNILFSDAKVKESSKIYVLAASSYFQESQAGSTVNDLSVFTDYMLKALGMSEFDGSVHYASSIPSKKSNKILLSDIYGYVYKETKKAGKAQVVQMSAGTNDLVLFSY